MIFKEIQELKQPVVFYSWEILEDLDAILYNKL